NVVGANDASREHPITITWTSMRGGQVFVVALCRACKIVRERFIPGRDDISSLAQLVGSDALAHAGCSHAGQIPSARAMPSASDLPVAQTEKRLRTPWPEEERTAPRPALPSVT